MADVTKIEVDLGENGGRQAFSSYDELRKFVVAESEAWAWMRHAHEPSGNQSRLPERIGQLLNEINDGERTNRSLEATVGLVPGYYSPDGNSVVHHESARGAELLAIRDMISPGAAAFAYAFGRGWVQISNANSPEMLRAVLTLAAPGVLDTAALVDRFARERAKFKNDLRTVMAEARAAEADRAAGLADATDAARRSIRRWATRRALRWHQYSAWQKTEGQAAIASVRAVQTTYEEFMALQAPSTYWRRKAEAHRRSETFAGWRLAVFFALAGLGLTAAFYLTASYFLQAQNDPRTSVYFVASAGLATVAGLVLWIGRLLTRLYLSEHHLRKDAEERRIMTTTYLALMRKSAAGDADRQVILNALFRNSSDGIVKDDGASDLGLSALVSRLGIPVRG